MESFLLRALLTGLFGFPLCLKIFTLGLLGDGLGINIQNWIGLIIIVWYKNAIPKHRIISWLAFLDKLSTKARQHKHDNSIDPNCSFCNLKELEIISFFVCVYSSYIWSSLFLNMGKIRPNSLVRHLVIDCG